MNSFALFRPRGLKFCTCLRCLGGKWVPNSTYSAHQLVRRAAQRAVRVGPQPRLQQAVASSQSQQLQESQESPSASGDNDAGDVIMQSASSMPSQESMNSNTASGEAMNSNTTSTQNRSEPSSNGGMLESDSSPTADSANQELHNQSGHNDSLEPMDFQTHTNSEESLHNSVPSMPESIEDPVADQPSESSSEQSLRQVCNPTVTDSSCEYLYKQSCTAGPWNIAPILSFVFIILLSAWLMLKAL